MQPARVVVKMRDAPETPCGFVGGAQGSGGSWKAPETPGAGKLRQSRNDKNPKLTRLIPSEDTRAPKRRQLRDGTTARLMFVTAGQLYSCTCQGPQKVTVIRGWHPRLGNAAVIQGH